MNRLASIASSVLSSLGFATLLLGGMLFALQVQQASAQVQQGNFCFTCPCLYPDTGWCDARGNACSWDQSRCGCNYISGCDPNIVPSNPDPP